MLRPFVGPTRPVYGWQDYPGLGKRWMANCDIPDFDLFPLRYGVQSIRFSGGLELGVLHHGLGLLAWLMRLGAPLDLSRHAALLLAVSNWCNRVGTADAACT